MIDFTFSSVIVSIFVGIGLSRLIESWGHIVQQKKTVKSSLLFVLASSWLFSFLIAHWLGLLPYRELIVDSVLLSYIVFLPSFLGTLSAHILTPNFSENLDFDQYYFMMAPRTHLIIGVFVISCGLTDLLIPETKPASLAVFLIMGGLFIFLSLIRNRNIHLIVLLILWIGWLTGLILNHYQLMV